MAKTILVCGYGPGISKAVADKFGAEGFSVALVARNASRLAEGVKALESRGVKAAAFPADLADPKAVKAMVEKARASLGSISVVEWTAYAGGAGNLLEADAAAIHAVIDVAITGLCATVQAALPDLKKERGAVLVTNGGFGRLDPQADAAAVKFDSMGLALANAAKHKLVRMLAEKLKPEGVYVGEVMVLGTVKGTAWDNGQATIDPSKIADQFWNSYSSRAPLSANVS